MIHSDQVNSYRICLGISYRRLILTIFLLIASFGFSSSEAAPTYRYSLQTCASITCPPTTSTMPNSVFSTVLEACLTHVNLGQPGELNKPIFQHITHPEGSPYSYCVYRTFYPGTQGYPPYHADHSVYVSGFADKFYVSAVPLTTCRENCVGDPIDPTNGAMVHTESAFDGSPAFNLVYSSTSDITNVSAKWTHSFSRRVQPVHSTTSYRKHAYNSDTSSLYDTEASACVSGFAEIKGRSPSWATAVPSFQNGICTLSINNVVVGTLPVWRPPYFDGQNIQFQTPLIGYDVIRDDGQIIRFPLLNGVLSSSPGVSLTLVPSANGFTVKDENDNVEVYDSSGKLQTVTARTGASITLSYDGSGRLSSVADHFGTNLSLGYDAAGRLGSVTKAGHSVAYSYDSSNRLAGVTRPDGTTLQYLYENTAFPNALTVKVDENGVRYSHWYYTPASAQSTPRNSIGKAYYTQEATGLLGTPYGVNGHNLVYNADGSVTVNDALGAVRIFTFARYGDRRLVTGISGSQCPTCKEGKATTYTSNGLVASRTDYRNYVTTYQYNSRNLETSRTEAFGTPRARTITTQWHPTYRLPTQIDEPGRRTTFTHDPNGNVLTNSVLDTATNTSRTSTFTYNGVGQVLTADGPRTDVNDVTTYSYYTCNTGYQCGRVHTITNALNQTTTFNTYNAHGQPLTITDANGVVTTLTYDARQRIMSRTAGSETTSFEYWPIGSIKKVTLPDSSFVQYVYDAAHRLKEIQDGEGNKITYTYDVASNRTKDETFDPSNALSQKRLRVFNQLSQLQQEVGAAGTAAVTTSFVYDANGNKTNENAPLGRNSVNAYDELNRLIQVTDPATGITRYGYNALDQLISVTDPRNKVTSYTYNALGDLTIQVSPDTGTTTNTYDSGGNLQTTTDARNVTATHSYDALNRVTQTAYPDQVIGYQYDQGANAQGRLTSVTDNSGQTSWAYTSLGRVTQRTQLMSSLQKSVGYGYNSQGQLTALTLPSGAIVEYGYSQGKVSSITVNGNSLLSGVLYEPFGPTRGWTWGNGTLAVRDFDQDGKVTLIDSAGLKTYGYDDAFRITSIADATTPSNSQSYGYDLLDRLTTATGSTLNQSWTYDANGNRLTQGGDQASTYSVSVTSNRISNVTGALSKTYTYDNAGNTLSDGTNTFTYNDAGRMIAATNGALTTAYSINALGQRVRKSNSNETTYFVYDEAGHLIGEYNNSGGLIQEIVWLGDIPVASLRLVSNVLTVYYIHTDHLNTPTLITQASNNQLRWRWDRHPFGTGTVNANPSGLGTFTFNLRFPGQYFDSETGLYYNMHRYYDPQAGRYVTSDPIGLRGGLNTYAYALSSPTMFTDPSGLDVYRGPGNYYGDVPRGGACERAVFSGDYIVAWVTCNPELPPPPPGPPPGDYGPQACPTEESEKFNLKDFMVDMLAPDWTMALGPLGKGGKLIAAAWTFGTFKKASKWEAQMSKRGWTPEMITEALQKGDRFGAENLVNRGNAATRYVHPQTGQSVVIDNVTNEVIHVGGPGFKY